MTQYLYDVLAMHLMNLGGTYSQIASSSLKLHAVHILKVPFEN